MATASGSIQESGVIKHTPPGKNVLPSKGILLVTATNTTQGGLNATLNNNNAAAAYTTSGRLFEKTPPHANSAKGASLILPVEMANLQKMRTVKRVRFSGLPDYNAADEELKIVMNRKKYK